MFEGIFIASLIGTAIQMFKEFNAPTIPAENWTNKELIHEDRMKGISEKEFSKNLANGKYKLIRGYPEPHRDPVSGKIIIENTLLYKEDVKDYGAHQAQKWVKQGKYNLAPEELKKEQERIEDEFKKLFDSL